MKIISNTDFILLVTKRFLFGFSLKFVPFILLLSCVRPVDKCHNVMEVDDPCWNASLQ